MKIDLFQKVQPMSKKQIFKYTSVKLIFMLSQIVDQQKTYSFLWNRYSHQYQIKTYISFTNSQPVSKKYSCSIQILRPVSKTNKVV